VTEHPHVDVFMRTYAAFTAGDMEALAELFAEDVVWHTPGRNPLSGDYERCDATFTSFAREFKLSGGITVDGGTDVGGWYVAEGGHDGASRGQFDRAAGMVVERTTGVRPSRHPQDRGGAQARHHAAGLFNPPMLGDRPHPDVVPR
jgi:ketosteroid isomerase-like protein